MSVQSISGVSRSASSDDISVKSDVQVRKLESQIKDWTDCPTTPPDTKKAIVGRLQAQLDSLKAGIENQRKAVGAANAESASSAGNLVMVGQPVLAPRYVPPMKVDTYV